MNLNSINTLAIKRNGVQKKSNMRSYMKRIVAGSVIDYQMQIGEQA